MADDVEVFASLPNVTKIYNTVDGQYRDTFEVGLEAHWPEVKSVLSEIVVTVVTDNVSNPKATLSTLNKYTTAEFIRRINAYKIEQRRIQPAPDLIPIEKALYKSDPHEELALRDVMGSQLYDPNDPNRPAFLRTTKQLLVFVGDRDISDPGNRMRAECVVDANRSGSSIENVVAFRITSVVVPVGNNSNFQFQSIYVTFDAVGHATATSSGEMPCTSVLVLNNTFVASAGRKMMVFVPLPESKIILPSAAARVRPVRLAIRNPYGGLVTEDTDGDEVVNLITLSPGVAQSTTIGTISIQIGDQLGNPLPFTSDKYTTGDTVRFIGDVLVYDPLDPTSPFTQYEADIFNAWLTRRHGHVITLASSPVFAIPYKIGTLAQKGDFNNAIFSGVGGSAIANKYFSRTSMIMNLSAQPSLVAAVETLFDINDRKSMIGL